MKLVNILSNRPYTYQELTDIFSCSKPKMRRYLNSMIESGMPIESKYNDIGAKEFYINTHNTGGELKRETDYFGLISDTHMGATACDEEALTEYYDIIKDRGIDTVFHCGDALSGQGVYKGQEFENKIHGINEQCQYFVDNYPEVDGKTIFITGNHDLKQFQASGVEVGDLIILMADYKGRDDFEYLGRYSGRVQLNEDGTDIELSHYMKGASSYTLGYRMQTRQRDEPPTKRSDILALGHKHVTLFADYNDQIMFEAGCFQGQTDYLLSKGINSTIAGWIVEIETDGKDITKVKPELLKF